MQTFNLDSSNKKDKVRSEDLEYIYLAEEIALMVGLPYLLSPRSEDFRGIREEESANKQSKIKKDPGFPSFLKGEQEFKVFQSKEIGALW